MECLTFKNISSRNLTLIVEPVADEYDIKIGDKIEILPPLYIDNRNTIDIEIKDEDIIIFLPEEAIIKKNGSVLNE